LELVNQSWKKYGCNIVSNGWNDLKKRFIIKVLVYSYKNIMFLDAIHIFELVGQSMIMKYIYEHIKNAIETNGT
jgi:hypothetical protein